MVTGKALKATTPETINSWWNKLCPDTAHDRIHDRAAGGIHGRKYGWGRKVRSEGAQDMEVGEMQEPIATTAEE